MSSPATNVASASRTQDGEEAMAPKVAAVLNVSSLIMSKPIRPGLVTFPTICMLMYEVGMLFQASNEACRAGVACASVRNGAPRGLGVGSAEALTRCLTGRD